MHQQALAALTRFEEEFFASYRSWNYRLRKINPK